MVVHSAGMGDRDGAAHVAAAAPRKAPKLRHVWVDSGYTGSGVRNLQLPGWSVEVVRRDSERNRAWRTSQMPLFTATRGFQLVKRRWIVERTFAWLGRHRRLSKDYEAARWASEAWIWVASARNLIRRLAA